MGKKLEKMLYLLLAFILLNVVGSYLFELYTKKFRLDGSPSVRISDDKLYKAEIIYTDRRSFMNWLYSNIPTGIGNGSPPTYEFVKLYNNKTGEFIGESNLCSIREYKIYFPSMESMEFSYGWDDIGYFEEIFYGNDVCTIRLKSSQILK